MSKPIKAFIARSFTKTDEEKLRPLLDQLNTFAQLGFICESAKPAESEQVSEKIQRMIHDADVFIGFFTRKYPIAADRNATEAEPAAAAPKSWIPPPWVLQESGCAVGLGRKLVFFREVGVELPELQGDLEYIEFDPANLSDALRRTNEMIVGLIKRGLAIDVQTTVQQEIQSPPPLTASTSDEAPPQQLAGSHSYFKDLLEAMSKKDAEAARKAFERGSADFSRGDPEREFLWRLLYARLRFESGESAAWEEIRQMESDNPSSPLPRSTIALCQRRAGELIEAAESYQIAADRAAADGGKSIYLLRAAETLHELSEWSQARRLLLTAFVGASAPTKLQILGTLYENLKATTNMIEAFGVGEYSLFENNSQPALHFRLGYDYQNDDLHELSIFHYKALLDFESPDADTALNNLAVAYSSMDTPINEVRYFTESANLGNSLAAGNLAYKYLNAGFVEEARKILEKASQIANHDSSVDQAWIDLRRKVESEETRDQEIRKAGVAQRHFLKKLGTAILIPQSPQINGWWSFPFVDLELHVSGTDVLASAKKAIQTDRATSLLFGLGGAQKSEREESYELAGQLDGCICRFALSIDTDVK